MITSDVRILGTRMYALSLRYCKATRSSKQSLRYDRLVLRVDDWANVDDGAARKWRERRSPKRAKLGRSKMYPPLTWESRGCCRFRWPRGERSPYPMSDPFHFCTQPGPAAPEMAEGRTLKGVRCPLFFHQTYTHKQACIRPPVVLEDFSRFAVR